MKNPNWFHEFTIDICITMLVLVSVYGTCRLFGINEVDVIESIAAGLGL